MSDVKVKIGAALDRDVTNVLVPLHKAVKDASDKIQQELAAIEKRYQALLKGLKTAQAAGAAASEGGEGGGGGGGGTRKRNTKAETEARRHQQQLARDKAAADRHASRADAERLREKKRHDEQLARDQAAADRHASRADAERLKERKAANRKLAQENERAAKEDARQQDQWHRQAWTNSQRRLRETEAQHRRATAERERTARREERSQRQAAMAVQRREERDARFTRRTLISGARSVMEGVTGALGIPTNIAEAVGANISIQRGVLEGMGADFSFGSAAGRYAQNNANATFISNQGMVGGDPRNSRRVAPETLLAEAQAAAIEGVGSTEDALNGLRQFIEKTGDLATVRPMLADMAKLAAATGASFEHTAAAAGEISLQLGNVADKPAKVMAVLRAFAGQSQIGTVEFANLAGSASKIVASARFFKSERNGGAAGEDVEGNMATLMGMAQLAKRGGAGSVAEQVTGLQTFVSQFNKPARIAAMEHALGHKIRDDKGDLSDVHGLLRDVVVATKGRDDLMQGAFADVRGQRVTRAYQQIYHDATNEAKKQNPLLTDKELGVIGGKAIDAEMDRFRNAKLDEMQISMMVAKAKETEVAKVQEFNIQMEQISRQLAKDVIPVLPLVAGSLRDAAQLIKSLVPAAALVADTNRGGQALQSASERTIGSLNRRLETGKPLTKEEVAFYGPLLEDQRDQLAAKAQEARANKPQADMFRVLMYEAHLLDRGIAGAVKTAEDWDVDAAPVGFVKGVYDAWTNDDVIPEAAASDMDAKRFDDQSGKAAAALERLNRNLEKGVTFVARDAGGSGNPPKTDMAVGRTDGASQ